MSNETENDGWRLFLEKCLGIKDIDMLDEFFKLFLTFAERDELAARALIVVELLKASKPQREIAKNLRVSIAKITRGSNELKTIKSNLKEYLLK